MNGPSKQLMVSSVVVNMGSKRIGRCQEYPQEPCFLLAVFDSEIYFTKESPLLDPLLVLALIDTCNNNII